jgi:pimeloyl-ACP methyl ester carboxylesterase
MITMPERVAVFPPAGSPLGWRSWAREFAAALQVTAFPAARPKGSWAHGHGRPVLLIPGFTSGDWSVIRMKAFLAALGYRVATAGIVFNPGPTPALAARLERAFSAAAEHGKVFLVGVSLGGVLARDLARRHPDHVAAVVTFCSPVRFPVTTPLAPFARLLGVLHDEAFVARRHTIAADLSVPVTAVHAAQDGVVGREACWLDPSPNSRNVVVGGRHMTIASNPCALSVLAEALERPPV